MSIKEFLEIASAKEGMLELFNLALLGFMTRKVLHESNNQITGVLGYINLAQHSSAFPGSINKFLQRTAQCCESTQNTNRVFLELFQERKSTTLDWMAEIDEAVSFCKKVLSSPISVHSPKNDSVPSISFPVSTIRRILLYILIAVHHEFPENGEIHVGISTERDEASTPSSLLTITISSQKPNPVHLPSLDYQDTASESMLIKELCCFLAEEVAIRCRGEIVRERYNPLSIMYRITLPGIEENTGRDNSLKDGLLPSTCFPQKSLKIILLEDQPIVCDFIRKLLNQEGHRVISYQDGKEMAQALSAMNLDMVDLFLLDICVPGINGLEIGSIIREKDPESKIVFYSALQDENYILDRFVLDEKTKFLQKPFKKEELFNLLQSVVAIKE